MKKIPLTRPYFDKDELEEVRKVLDSGWVSQGPETRKFENDIAKYLGVKFAVSVANCTSALHLSLLSIGVKAGDEVIVSDYTFPATAHAVLYCGAKPIFADIDAHTYNIDPDLIERKITKKTKAIIPVHTFGQPADMDRIIAVARKNGLKVIEDAACALGAEYKGRFAGTIGDIGCFSFHARKGITTGEGGMVVTDDPGIAEKVRQLSVFGATAAWKRPGRFVVQKFTELGYNYKLSDIAAAVGVAQLKKIDRIIDRRRTLAAHWTRRLENMDFVSAPRVLDDVKHVYQSYVVKIDKRIDRNALIERFLKKGIGMQIGTYSCHIQPVYRSKDRCPNSISVHRTALALPLYHELKKDQIDLVADLLEKTMEELK